MTCQSGQGDGHERLKAFSGFYRWLECDGRSYTNTEFPALAQVMGAVWGTGTSGKVFRVPDLHGMFLRGWQHQSGVASMSPSDQQAWKGVPGDPGAAARTPRHEFGIAGDRVGSFQPDINKEHLHDEIFLVENGQKSVLRFARAGTSGGTQFVAMDVSSSPLKTSKSGGAESRPGNAYVMYLVYAGGR